MYKIVSHTADIGIEAWGKTLSELFENAALGMTSILSQPEKFRPQTKVSFSISSQTWEFLLVDWLGEILYQFSVRKLGFSKFKIENMKPFEIKGSAWGEKIVQDRHAIFREIKAVTYHDLKIRKTKRGYSTRIIFDI